MLAIYKWLTGCCRWWWVNEFFRWQFSLVNDASGWGLSTCGPVAKLQTLWDRCTKSTNAVTLSQIVKRNQRADVNDKRAVAKKANTLNHFSLVQLLFYVMLSIGVFWMLENDEVFLGNPARKWWQERQNICIILDLYFGRSSFSIPKSGIVKTSKLPVSCCFVDSRCLMRPWFASIAPWPQMACLAGVVGGWMESWFFWWEGW